MDKLSERLEGVANASEEVWRDDYKVGLLREAAALAKRYEDAPVRSVLYLNQAGGLVCYVSLPEGMAGQRVRIVLDKEG